MSISKTQANTAIYQSTKKRYSNIELLRLLAMLLVMVGHANFRSLGGVDYAEINSSPTSAFLRFLVQAASGISVNVFVLISGWFGIKGRTDKLLSLLFQVVLVSVIMALVSIITNRSVPTMEQWKTVFCLGGSYWFVKSYLLLFIFAPVLNSFVDHVSHNQLKLFLICFYIFQILFGWLTDTKWFDSGYSPISFMGLYLLARYLRTSNIPLGKKWESRYLLIYCAITLFTAVVSMFLPTYLFYVYSSPLLIIAAGSLLLFFCCLNLDSKFINGIAVSSFAVYLVHANPMFFDTVYTKTIASWHSTLPVHTFLLYTAAFIVGIFLSAVIIDQMRIFLWNLMHKRNSSS